MDELMERNRPTPTPQPTVQEQTPPPEVHPTKEEWAETDEAIYTLARPHRETELCYLKKVSELLAQLPPRRRWTNC